MIIQYCDDVIIDGFDFGTRMYQAEKRHIQESMLTTHNGCEGFEDYLDCGEDQMPDHVSIIDENEFFLRYEGEF